MSNNFFYPPIIGTSTTSSSGGTGADVNAYYALTQADGLLPNSKVLAPGSGISISVVGSQVFITATGSGGGGGGVVSVALAAPPEFTVSGSPVTSSGTLTFTKASQSANLGYLSPDGSSGVPTFRAINANDFYKSLVAGQNIAFSNVGGVLTIAASSIWPGSLIGSIPASSGGLGTTTAPTAGQVPIGTSSSTYTPALIAAGPGIQINTGSGFMNIAASAALGGTVTSVGVSAPADVFTVGSSPITTAGTISLSKVSQASNKFYVSPDGASGNPTFRSIVTGDIASLFSAGPNISIVGGSTLTISATGLTSGTVTSVNVSPPSSIITASGGPITTSGTITESLVSQAASTFWGGPLSGAGTKPWFRAIVGTDLGLALQAGANITFSNSGSSIVIASTASGGGGGTITSSTAGQVPVYTASTTIAGGANFTASAGAITLGSAGNAGSLRLNGATSGDCTIAVPAVAGTSTHFTLPGSNGTVGQRIVTDGTGILSYDSGGAFPAITAKSPRLYSQTTCNGGGTSWVGVGALAGVNNITSTVSAVPDADGNWLNYLTPATSGSVNGAQFISVVTGTTDSWSSLPRDIITIKTGANASDIQNVRIWVGLGNTTSVNTDTCPNTCAMFRFSTVAGDTNWQCCNSDGTAVVVDSGVAVASNTVYTMAIDGSTNGTLKFYINGSLVCTTVTNYPANSVYAGVVYIVPQANAAKNIRIKSCLYDAH